VVLLELAALVVAVALVELVEAVVLVA